MLVSTSCRVLRTKMMSRISTTAPSTMMTTTTTIPKLVLCRWYHPSHHTAAAAAAGGSKSYTNYNNNDDDDDDTPKPRIALVVGSSGAMGWAVCRQLLNRGMIVIGADVVDSAETAQLHTFVPMPNPIDSIGSSNNNKNSSSTTTTTNISMGQVTARLTEGVIRALEEIKDSNDKKNKDKKKNKYDFDDDNDSSSSSSKLPQLDVIVVASGGWESDPRYEFDTPENYGDGIDRMMRMNVYPVVAAGYVAQYYGSTIYPPLMVVMGATAALSATPGMMGYGLSKTAAHAYVQTLGCMTGLAMNTRSQRAVSKPLRQMKPALDNMTVVGILPTKLDTPSNRRAEPKADFAAWTRPQDIAKEIGSWVDHVPLRPHSGSLIKVFPSTNEEGEVEATFQLSR